MKNIIRFEILAIGFAATTTTHAYEFRVRFVERIGDADSVLEGNTIDARDFSPRRIRVQFGVFDDAESAAPAGGYLGWNFGAITVNGDAANSSESRTPGRLAPFDFAPNGNGEPAMDPFEALVGVDNTLGVQTRIHLFGAPLPDPVVRGRNSFFSTYEITVDPTDDAGAGYSIDFSGNVLVALGWNLINQESGPVHEDEPRPLIYAPVPGPPRAFTATLHVVVPSPATAAILGGVGLVLYRRRR